MKNAGAGEVQETNKRPTRDEEEAKEAKGKIEGAEGRSVATSRTYGRMYRGPEGLFDLQSESC